MNDSDDPNTRSRPPAHTRGSGLRPLEDVLLSEELQKKNPNNTHPSSTANDGSVVGFTNKKDNNPIPTSLTESDRARARARALEMLRDRNVDRAEDLVDSTDPQAVIGTCEWWDRQDGAKPGLLVWKIRQGGVTDRPPAGKAQKLREVFDRYVTAHPVDSRLCSHMALAARKWPGEDETCPGQLMVVAAVYPVLEMQCDGCGFEASLTPRAMKEAV